MRLSRWGAGGSAGDALRELENVASTLSPPEPRASRWWGPSSRARATPSLAERLPPLVERLEREHDASARRTLSLRTELARIERGDADLVSQIHLLRALGGQAEAAARELRVQDPARSSMLSDALATTLPQRTRDILTQIAIARQARLTLDIMLENEAVLARALETARTATASALAVAAAALRTRTMPEHEADVGTATALERTKATILDTLRRARSELGSGRTPGASSALDQDAGDALGRPSLDGRNDS